MWFCFHLKWLKVNHTPQKRAIQVFQIIIHCSCMHTRHTCMYWCVCGVRACLVPMWSVCIAMLVCMCVCLFQPLCPSIYLYLSVEMCVNRRAGKNSFSVCVREANKQRTRQTARNIPYSIRIKSHCIFVITMSFVLNDHYRIDFNFYFKRFSYTLIAFLYVHISTDFACFSVLLVMVIRMSTQCHTKLLY